MIDDLQFATGGCKILPVLAAEADIETALKNNQPKEVPQAPETSYEKASVVDHNAIDFSEISSDDPRLDRLLDILKEKGVLSVLDVERIKFS